MTEAQTPDYDRFIALLQKDMAPSYISVRQG